MKKFKNKKNRIVDVIDKKLRSKSLKCALRAIERGFYYDNETLIDITERYYRYFKNGEK